MPFWSSKTRVEKIIKTAAAYASFEPHSITLDDFLNDWIPGLKKDGLLIGVNWSGPKATGYDIAPDEVKASIQYYAGRPKM